MVKSRYYKNRNRPFEDWFNEIYDSLEKGNNLSRSQYEWIFRLRIKLNDNKNSIPKENIELLDKINKFIGYDWKIGKNYESHFDQRVKEIASQLEKGKTLTNTQRNWLSKQKIKVKSKNKQAISSKQIQKIDECTKFLGYDWKTGRTKSIFNEHYNSIIKAIERNKGFTIKQEKWLYSQKHRYAVKDHLKIPNDELEKLNHLIKVLDLKWETLINNSINRAIIKENKNSRNLIENWIKKYYEFLNLSGIERSIGAPRGTLQKFYRYDRKLEYKWIEAILEIKKGMK